MPDFTGVVASVKTAYTVRATRVGLRVARDINYSYEIEQPFYALTDVGVEVTERITSVWDIVGRTSWQRLGYRNIEVVVGDGTLGWPPAAPYDAIVVTAAGPFVPPTLRGQLRPGGRLVMPVGQDSHGQSLVRITRGTDEEDREERLSLVSFVPLIGAEGWRDATRRQTGGAT